MLSFKKGIFSPVGKKILMALTGLAMLVFLITHVAANLQLYTPDGTPYNKYSYFLISQGWLLIALELGLLAMLIAHVVTAIVITVQNKKARGGRYAAGQVTKGGPTKWTIGSRTMPITGLLILIFIVLHLKTFKYGPGVEEGYIQEADGVVMRDLHRLVVETFQDPMYVIFYAVMMIFVGFHLRHGFWSAFQSLGAAYPRISPFLYKLSFVLAVLIAGGFFFIPLWIYFDPLGIFVSSFGGAVGGGGSLWS